MEYDFYWNHCVFLSFYEGHKSVKHTDMYSKYYPITNRQRFLFKLFIFYFMYAFDPSFIFINYWEEKRHINNSELHYDPWVDLKIFLRVCQGYRCKIFMEI